MTETAEKLVEKEKEKKIEEAPEEELKEVEEHIEEELKETEKEKKKEEKTGIAYIKSTPNNTIIHITDLAGATISRVSGGMITKHSRLKANPTIAMFAAKRASERALDLGITRLYVRIRGKTNFNLGPGSHAAVKSLSKSGLLILNVLDAQRVPRGGPKKKGGKRGRRV